MEILIKKVNEDTVEVRANQESTFQEMSGLLLNGLLTTMEHVVEKTKDQGIDEEQIRSQLHDMMVINFSAAMLAFDPKSKDYKTAEEEGA